MYQLLALLHNWEFHSKRWLHPYRSTLWKCQGVSAGEVKLLLSTLPKSVSAREKAPGTGELETLSTRNHLFQIAKWGFLAVLRVLSEIRKVESHREFQYLSISMWGLHARHYHCLSCTPLALLGCNSAAHLHRSRTNPQSWGTLCS